MSLDGQKHITDGIRNGTWYGNLASGSRCSHGCDPVHGDGILQHWKLRVHRRLRLGNLPLRMLMTQQNHRLPTPSLRCNSLTKDTSDSAHASWCVRAGCDWTQWSERKTAINWTIRRPASPEREEGTKPELVRPHCWREIKNRQKNPWHSKKYGEFYRINGDLYYAGDDSSWFITIPNEYRNLYPDRFSYQEGRAEEAALIHTQVIECLTGEFNENAVLEDYIGVRREHIGEFSIC